MQAVAEHLLQEGRVDDAVEELQRQVRADPSDVKQRVFLFQLFAVNGLWPRALNQLEVAGELDPGALAMVQTYREVLRCEAFRVEVFSGKRSPLMLGRPEEWAALLVEALRLSAEGKHSPAGDMRARALEQAPATEGSVWLESAGSSPASGRNGEESAADDGLGAPFAWIADADSRLGPVLEAVLNGRYYWLPLHRVREVVIEKPADLRDLVWTPAHFTWANGGTAVGFIPTRYPGSERSADERIRLARRTEWSEIDAGTFFGLGQRVLVTDSDEHPLLDVRRIRLNSEAWSDPESVQAADEPAEG